MWTVPNSARNPGAWGEGSDGPHADVSMQLCFQTHGTFTLYKLKVQSRRAVPPFPFHAKLSYIDPHRSSGNVRPCLCKWVLFWSPDRLGGQALCVMLIFIVSQAGAKRRPLLVPFAVSRLSSCWSALETKVTLRNRKPEEEEENPPDQWRIAEHWERCVSVGFWAMHS